MYISERETHKTLASDYSMSKQKKVFHIELGLSYDVMEDLLDSASRGSDYWCENRLGFSEPVKNVLYGGTCTTIYDYEGATEKDKDGKWIPKAYVFNLKKIEKGLAVIAVNSPADFGDILSGDYDNNTGDVFLQYCLFGEVIYG